MPIFNHSHTIVINIDADVSWLSDKWTSQAPIAPLHFYDNSVVLLLHRNKAGARELRQIVWEEWQKEQETSGGKGLEGNWEVQLTDIKGL